MGSKGNIVHSFLKSEKIRVSLYHVTSPGNTSEAKDFTKIEVMARPIAA